MVHCLNIQGALQVELDLERIGFNLGRLNAGQQRDILTRFEMESLQDEAGSRSDPNARVIRLCHQAVSFGTKGIEKGKGRDKCKGSERGNANGKG